MSKMKDLYHNKAVTDVNNIPEFLEKYYKKSRYTGRGDEYAQALLNYHQERFDKEGFDIISHHDSNTGDVVSFYK